MQKRWTMSVVEVDGERFLNLEVHDALTPAEAHGLALELAGLEPA